MLALRLPVSLVQNPWMPLLTLKLVGGPGSPLPLLAGRGSPALPLLASSVHTSCVLERARQSTRIRKRKINEANKKKKEERLRKNPPPLPRKIQLMQIAKGLGKDPLPLRAKDTKPFPVDDVWAEMWHTYPRFPVSEALAMLREHYHPTMLNVPDALIWTKIEFNLQASKKDKYLDEFTAMIPVFHPFERGVATKQIMVLAKNPEALKDAESAGAARAGGIELLEEVAKGRVDVTDIDYFLAHEDIEKELKPLLGIVREKMPKRQAGTLGTDIYKMVKTFSNGMEVTVTKPKPSLGYAEDPSYGMAEFQVGRLNMEDSAVEANLRQALTSLREKAPLKRTTGGWVTRCQMYCQGPLRSRFDVCHPMVDDARLKAHIESQKQEAVSL